MNKQTHVKNKTESYKGRRGVTTGVSVGQPQGPKLDSSEGPWFRLASFCPLKRLRCH